MKNTSVFLTILLVVLMSWFVSNYAMTDVTVEVDGKKIVFPDQKPFLDEKNRVLVPVRFIAEQLGAKVEWDDETMTVILKKENTQIELEIGFDRPAINGVLIPYEKRLDAKPKIINGRAYVPLRFVSETFGVKVGWIDKTSIVVINTKTAPVQQKKSGISSSTPKEFVKILEILSDKVKIIDKVMVYHSNGNPDYENCELMIDKNAYEYDYIVQVKNYKTETLKAAKEVLKVFYPRGYEEVYKKLMEAVNGEVKINGDQYLGIKGLYFDNRYCSITKTEFVTIMFIGKIGVKY